MEIKYQTDYIRYRDRVNMLEQNLIRAYALIFSTYCTKVMQSRVEQHADFENEIMDDPIKLLEVIKVLLHDTVKSKYPYTSVTNSLRNFIMIKQNDHEQLLDYAKRFRQARDLLKSQMGTEILDKFVTTTSEYEGETTQEKKEEIQDEAFHRWSAYVLIKNSDQAKYGSLLNGMATQYAMGHNQFPGSMQKAVDIMSNHKPDNQKDWNKRQNDFKKKDNIPGVKKESSFAQNQ